MDELQAKIDSTQKDRDEIKRSLEYLRAEHENLKIEIDKDKLVQK
jgi:regulator of replication initiation timing